MIPWRFLLLTLELNVLSYSRTHLLFSYHESGSQYQSYIKGKRKCSRALPNHWLLLVYINKY